MATEPLEQKKIEILKDGVMQMVPGLHAGWVEDIHFLLYYPPPSTNNASIKDEWIETMEFLIEDFTWLLKLSHHRFWSQVKHDVAVHQCLVSYLNHAPRFYDLNCIINKEDVQEYINQIHRLVFMIYLRMSTYKESKTDFLSSKTFAAIIYENYLFDIPKMMDLSVLYGQDNHALLNKMISNVFAVQDGYHNDLREAAQSVLKVLDNTTEQLGLVEHSDQNLSASNIIKQMNITELQDKILFIVDTCVSLYHFLDIYPPGNAYFDEQTFATRLSHFYEHTVMVLVHELHSRSRTDDYSLITELQKRLSYARGCITKVFRSLIQHNCIQPLLENSYAAEDSTSSQHNANVESLLYIYTSVLSDRRYLRDYNEVFPILEDLEIIQQAPGQLDQTRIDYILHGIELIERNNDKINGDSELAWKLNDLSLTANKDNEIAFSDDEGEVIYDGASAKPVLNGVELDSLISQVNDLLPDLGCGFIEACLDYYNYSSEAVINALLEDNLPPVLQTLDRNDTSRKAVPQMTEPEASVLESRVNVFDHDEFDIFNNPKVDASRIHIGKKNQTEKNLLDNKSDVRNVNEIYQRFTNVLAAGDEEDQMISLEYDDEYDDTYDSHLVGSTEPDADESESRPFTTPRVLLQSSKEKVQFAEEDSDDEQPDNKLNFVQNPALLREQAEQRRQSKLQNRGPPGGNRNVKGKPKGQGQDSNTLRNRALKDKNKAARANHNRKAMSDKKHSKGMM